MLKRILISICFIVLLILPAGSAEAKRSIKDVYVVIFVLDGLNYDTFNRALKEKELPNIKRYLIDGGAYFERMFSLFSPTSSTVYQSMMTGLFPGHAGIVYLEWFDRKGKRPINYFSISGQNQMDKDLLNWRALQDPDEAELYPPSNLFKILSDYGTAGIYSSYNAGVTYRRPTIPVPAVWAAFGSGREEMLDRYAYEEVNKLFNGPIDNIPRLSLIGLYSFDFFGHHFGAESRIIGYNIEGFDRFLGGFVELLKQRGILDKTYIIAAADHGMHSTPKSKLSLTNFVKKLGVKLYAGEKKRKQFDAYVSERGVTVAHIYLKGQEGWPSRPTLDEMRSYRLASGKEIDVIKKLIDAKEIKFVVARDGFHKVHVFSKEGEGLITWSTKEGRDWYRYDVVGGLDPLEMGASDAASMTGKGFYSPEIWLARTAGHKYPDAIVQLAQIFADGRGGDIFVIPENDWVFYRKKMGSHGSIIGADMHVPFMMRGPEVPTGRYDHALLPDLYPTILEWFDIKLDKKYYDGRHLFKERVRPLKEGYIAGRTLPLDSLSRLKKARKKLELIYSDPSPDLNMQIVEEQMKRIDANVKILLQQGK